MDIAQLVLSKIVDTQSLTEIFDRGITRAFFPDRESRAVFDTITTHNTKYGKVPELRGLQRAHPNYGFIEAPETFDELIDQLRELRAIAILEHAVQGAVENLDRGSAKVKAILNAALTQVEAEVAESRERVWQEGIEERIATYREYSESPGLKGIPCGFETIDNATLGFQPGQLITITGPPKAGKTTLVLLCVYAALLRNKSVLLFSFEMGAAELFEILDAIHAQVSVSLLRSGELSDRARERLERELRTVPERFKAKLVVVEDPHSVTNLSGIGAKGRHHRPDIIFVDGIYFLEDHNGERRGTPGALRNIIEGTKQMAQRDALPIVVTTQINVKTVGRDGPDPSNTYGSQSYGQYSDVLLTLWPVKDEPTISLLKILAARQAANVETYVRLDRDIPLYEETDYDPTASADEGDFYGALAS